MIESENAMRKVCNPAGFVLECDVVQATPFPMFLPVLAPSSKEPYYIWKGPDYVPQSCRIIYLDTKDVVVRVDKHRTLLATVGGPDESRDRVPFGLPNIPVQCLYIGIWLDWCNLICVFPSI